MPWRQEGRRKGEEGGTVRLFPGCLLGHSAHQENTVCLYPAEPELKMGVLSLSWKTSWLVTRVPTRQHPLPIPMPCRSPQQLKGTQDHYEIERLHVECQREQSQEGKCCDGEIEPGTRREVSLPVTSQTSTTSSGSPALSWLPQRPVQPQCIGPQCPGQYPIAGQPLAAAQV